MFWKCESPHPVEKKDPFPTEIQLMTSKESPSIIRFLSPKDTASLVPSSMAVVPLFLILIPALSNPIDKHIREY